MCGNVKALQFYFKLHDPLCLSWLRQPLQQCLHHQWDIRVAGNLRTVMVAVVLAGAAAGSASLCSPCGVFGLPRITFSGVILLATTYHSCCWGRRSTVRRSRDGRNVFSGEIVPLVTTVMILLALRRFLLFSIPTRWRRGQSLSLALHTCYCVNLSS